MNVVTGKNTWMSTPPIGAQPTAELPTFERSLLDETRVLHQCEDRLFSAQRAHAHSESMLADAEQAYRDAAASVASFKPEDDDSE